jgi:intracellular sulfur oxidation DsrE/DsrF family protein
MKKSIVLLLVCLASSVFSQKASKIILHLQTGDSLVYKSVVNQISNLKKSIPEATIEVMCHGPGLNFILKEKSRYVNRLDKLKLENVSVVGCEYTMSAYNYTKEDLVSFATTVPFGITELATKQAEGWIYIKLGF